MTDKRSTSSWDFGTAFWGLLLIVGGALFLLDSFDVISLDYSTIWKLWPLLIIASGLSIIPIRNSLSAIGAGLLVAALVGVSALSLTGNLPAPESSATEQRANITELSRDIDKLDVTVQAGASDIRIGSESGVTAVSAVLKSSFADLRKSSERNGSTQSVKIIAEGNNRWWIGEYKNDLSISLTRSLPVDLNIDTGAVHINGDLSEVNLRGLRIDSGASDIDIKLGAKSTQTDVRFDIGVSSVEFKVPKNSGVSLRLDDGISGKNIPDLREITKGYYETANYSTAEHRINIIGDKGMSNLTFRYY